MVVGSNVTFLDESLSGLCPDKWMSPSPAAAACAAPPVAPSVVRLSLARTKGTVSTLRTWLVMADRRRYIGGIAFRSALPSAAFRVRVVLPPRGREVCVWYE